MLVDITGVVGVLFIDDEFVAESPLLELVDILLLVSDVVDDVDELDEVTVLADGGLDTFVVVVEVAEVVVTGKGGGGMVTGGGIRPVPGIFVFISNLCC